MRHTFLFVFFLLLFGSVTANNVQLTNINVTNNAGNNGKIVTFDLSWENSWRTSSTNNYDGVWVFFKFKDNNGQWYPLRFTGTNNNAPAGFTITISNNFDVTGVGAYIHRSSLGFGTCTLTGVQAGIQSLPGTFDIRGFAIEMVYVPQGSFYLGDGSSLNAFKTGNTNNPYQVTGNGASVTYGTGTGQLNDPIAAGITTGTNYAGFPTGFAPFWMMKYELSQGAYRDFLNTLTYTQQASRNGVAVPPNSVVGTKLEQINSNPLYRQIIEIAVPGVAPGTPAVYGCDADNDNIFNEASDGEWVSLSSVTWADCAAYLDWAGLRPMTEFEYEKACRGPLNPVQDEYAWGNANMTNYPLTLANAFTENEIISNSSAFFGNAINDSSGIAVSRGGVFATAISTRVSSGAGYYGAMELSGSLFEITVAAQNEAGRSFTGKAGDGLLTTAGNANENYWPGVNGITGTTVSPGIYDGGLGVRSDGGIRYRGGYFGANTFLEAKISDRRTGSQAGSGSFVDLSNIAAPILFPSIRGVRDAN